MTFDEGLHFSAFSFLYCVSFVCSVSSSQEHNLSLEGSSLQILHIDVSEGGREGGREERGGRVRREGGERGREEGREGGREGGVNE